MVDEEAIWRKVFARRESAEVREDWLTPSGRRRSTPVYWTVVRNDYLNKERTLKAGDPQVLEGRARAQLQQWAEHEARARIREANRDAKQEAREQTEDADADAKATLTAIQNILSATLDVNDRIEWQNLLDARAFPPFSYAVPSPVPPVLPFPPELPTRPFFWWLVPSVEQGWRARCDFLLTQHAATVHDLNVAHAAALHAWSSSYEAARVNHAEEESRFATTQREHNEGVAAFRQRFESAEPAAVEEYVQAVFERSEYPEGFSREYAVAFDPASGTVVVDVELPPQEAIPSITAFKFDGARNDRVPIRMKRKAHDELYDQALKQTVLRSIHEVFESVYLQQLQRVVLNGWVTRVDAATGHDARRCVVSVSACRAEFESLNLARIDPSECLRRLKALTAGPLSELAPVRPILVFDRADARFIEARDVLDGLVAAQNLAEMPWADFEHLVRELFSKMFTGDGAEVRVTQASRDLGVDAIAFDPDPIRGGKFVIQAKRYTKTVSASAVRELYGTMLNEGATKGILVTTASFGPDSREFAKDKPMTLIDGANLVYLLNQYGYRARIDIAAARATRGA